MKDRLTQFGTKCRELRIRHNVSMGDQAKALGISVAYISAIECGKRAVPEDYPQDVAHWLSLSDQDSQTLRDLASGERTLVKVFPKNGERAMLADDFARNLNELSVEGVRQLRLMLETCKSTNYSDHEIRERASLARAVFKLGAQISFDVLRIVERQLPSIDPEFSLQVNPDGSMGDHVQIISESDGKSISRFVSTEWFYDAAFRETEESRFMLAHELAHWILHRNASHTFMRFSRPGTIVSSPKNKRIEYEADFFAREFLMPLSIVEQFKTAEILARKARVPLWVAQKRIRELQPLMRNERDQIKRLSGNVDSNVKTPPRSSEVVAQQAEGSAKQGALGSVVLSLPLEHLHQARSRISKAKTKKKTIKDLPLFEYAESQHRFKAEPSVHRGTQWFSDFGWRG